MSEIPEQLPAGDTILRAMTDDGAFRVMTICSTETVREAVRAQDTHGIPARQLGQLITSAVLVRETMAPPCRVQVLLRDRIGNQIVGDAHPEGRTRGLVQVEDDVLGVRLTEGGLLQVSRSLPGRAPHQGVVEVDPETGIDQALASYFLRSEQIETMVAVACVANEEDEIEVAGGFVIQLLPELTAPPLAAMKERLRAFGELEPTLVQHSDPQWLLEALLGDTVYTALAASPVLFACACGDEKAAGAVAALGADELRDLIAKGESLRVTCDYCQTTYSVGPDEFRRALGE